LPEAGGHHKYQSKAGDAKQRTPASGVKSLQQLKAAQTENLRDQRNIGC